MALKIVYGTGDMPEPAPISIPEYESDFWYEYYCINDGCGRCEYPRSKIDESNPNEQLNNHHNCREAGKVASCECDECRDPEGCDDRDYCPTDIDAFEFILKCPNYIPGGN